MKSILSGGGPLISIELDAVDRWHGVSGSAALPSLTGSLNDYQRACTIRDYLGKLTLGDRTALVLGDMPLETSIWHPRNELPKIVRVYYGDPGADMENLLESAGPLDFGDPAEVLSIDFQSSSIVIFDSAYAGSDAGIERLSFSLPVGKYLVVTKQFQPDKRTSVLIHMFVPSQ